MSATAIPSDRFRFASPSDSAALVPLINIAFRPEQVAIEGDRISLPALRPYFQSGRFLVLEDAAGISGCVYAEVRGARGYIGLLAVRPELHRRGLGRRLMDLAEQYLVGEGCSAADLRTISARDDLVPMYKHFGYQQTGTEEMPSHVKLKIPCHFIVMSKNLGDARRNS
jgi:GNAT superfamily N-acetyltransferase